MKKVLILGGTMEARRLADILAKDKRFQVTFSLAGLTANPLIPKGDIRVGGFGGADGLADYLESEKISILVDATHPFASRISQSAATASAATGIACLRLERKEWKPLKDDRWQVMESIEQAAESLPSGARPLVTVGRQDIAPFFARLDIKVLARMIEAPETPPLAPHKVLRNRPPFRPEDELLLMRTEHITHLVTKNSGGKATSAKLQAARTLRLPVIMISRPATPDLPTAHSVDALLEMLAKATKE
jgi:precorrin-6A/cobalt-precorrin-6A reductase